MDFTRINRIADYLIENNSLTIHTPNHNELRVKLRKENYYLSAGPYSDWNEDGLPDMLTSDYNGYVWIWIQQATGVAEGTTPIPSRTLSASSNPFMELVTVTGEGFSAGTLQIFDVSGRTVLEEPFSGSFAWDGSGVSNGTYFVRVTDNFGSSSLRLLKL
jgi:hypothetical protein